MCPSYWNFPRFNPLVSSRIKTIHLVAEPIRAGNSIRMGTSPPYNTNPKENLKELLSVTFRKSPSSGFIFPFCELGKASGSLTEGRMFESSERHFKNA